MNVPGSGWGSVALLKKLDTENYNVIVISPRNYFLFTPLLPSCPTGTVEHRSIMEPLRHILRHKKGTVQFFEADATNIDHERRVITINDNSDSRGTVHKTEVPFDYLVIGVGAENATFGMFPPLVYPAVRHWLTRRCRNPRCEGECLLPEGDCRCAAHSQEGDGLH